jgi:large subunit ribosomal protein L13
MAAGDTARLLRLPIREWRSQGSPRAGRPSRSGSFRAREAGRSQRHHPPNPPPADVEERWLLFDASKHTLGRMAARIATSLIGKDRPTYTPSEHGATHVVVIQSANVRMSGRKLQEKVYQTYSGYPGGRYEWSVDEVRERRPNDMVKLAVRRMLPKGRLGKKMLSHLKVYPGALHPHEAQKPVLVEKI